MKYNERQYTLNYADCNVKDTTGKLLDFEFIWFIRIIFLCTLYSESKFRIENYFFASTLEFKKFLN